MDFRDRTDEIDDLWIARKAARLGAYQKLYDDCEDALDRGWDEDPKTNAQLTKAMQSALRSAAEELGQLPQRTQPAPEKHEVTFRYEMQEANDV